MLDIKYELVGQRKAKPDWNALGFGKYFTDHMFIMDSGKVLFLHRASRVPYHNP